METQTAAATAKRSGTKDVHAIINDRLIEQLKKGIVPWRTSSIEAGVPKNLISRKPYRGMNVMLLASLGYERNFFITENQLAEIGGGMKAGERPHTVVYWNFRNNGSESGTDKKKQPVLSFYSVYNIAQCAGMLDVLSPEIAREQNPIMACEQLVGNIAQCAPILHKEPRACYDPLEDYVNMPKQKSFKSDESYYSMLFHQLVHSTGHHTRLDRMKLVQMSEHGGNKFSQEELVAEIGASYLQSLTGITSAFQPSEDYLQGWIEKLKSDRYFIFTAASLAQNAIDFLLNVQASDSEDARQAEE